MSKIELAKDTRDALARALSRYLKDEHDVEVAGFDAHFLLDFILETLGPHIYNQGLADAQDFLLNAVVYFDAPAVEVILEQDRRRGGQIGG